MRVGNLPGIRRLPMYLNILNDMLKDGVKSTSTTALSAKTGYVVSVVRKDLSMTGSDGVAGVGYAVPDLIDNIVNFLGWNNPFDAFLVGVGSLGSAILGHKEFRRHGLNIVAAFDVDPNKVGWSVQGVEVLPLAKLAPLAQRMHIGIGVITVPGEQAQAVADLMVEGGIPRIWNFAPQILSVPDTVTVQREDLSAGLAELLVRSTEK